MDNKSLDSRKLWQERIGAQDLSGQTVFAFCQERGLKEWAFYSWKKKFKGIKKPSSRFIAVSAPSPLVSDPPPRVELPNGIRIELGGGLESAGVVDFLLRVCKMSGKIGEVGDATR